MINWDLVISLVVAVIVIGALALGVYLLTKTVQLAAGCVLTLLGLAIILALWLDTLNGWPVLRRVAWSILWLADTFYQAVSASLSPIPALPINPYQGG